MNSYAFMLNRIVRPALESEGFVRHGRFFSVTSPLGDVGAVEFQGSRHSWADEKLFYVNVGVLPSAWIDWINRATGRDSRDLPSPLSAGLWGTRLDPRVGFGNSFAWALRPDDRASAERVGRKVVARLKSEVLPTITALLDREEFLRRIRDVETEFRGLGTTRLWAAMALLVDGDATAERDRLLDLLESRDPDFAAWARQRVPRPHGASA